MARTNDNGKWQMLGILTFLDPPRPDTKETIERSMEYGVDVKMITGARKRLLDGRRASWGARHGWSSCMQQPPAACRPKHPWRLSRRFARCRIVAWRPQRPRGGLYELCA